MGALHCEQSLGPPFASLVPCLFLLKVSLWVGPKGLGVKISTFNVLCPRSSLCCMFWNAASGRVQRSNFADKQGKCATLW